MIMTHIAHILVDELDLLIGDSLAGVACFPELYASE